MPSRALEGNTWISLEGEIEWMFWMDRGQVDIRTGVIRWERGEWKQRVEEGTTRIRVLGAVKISCNLYR